MIGTLDNSELALVEFVGRKRVDDAISKNRQQGNDQKLAEHCFNDEYEGRVSNDVVSAAGEFFVARTLGLFWHALSDNPRNMPFDVGDRHNVKTITNPGHNLIVKAKNDATGTYWLVLAHLPEPELEIIGWFPGAQCHRFWNERLIVPGYLIPKKNLYPLSEYKEEA
jgi:hypothetical protein